MLGNCIYAILHLFWNFCEQKFRFLYEWAQIHEAVIDNAIPLKAN